jgi:hypothetical protein
MEKGVEGSGATRQSHRARTKTPKALEQEERRRRVNPGDSDSGDTPVQRGKEADSRADSDESETGDESSTAATAPEAPRPNRTTMKPDNRNQAALKTNLRLTAKGGEQLINGKANTAINAQNGLLIELVKTLVKDGRGTEANACRPDGSPYEDVHRTN